ncbi:MAG: hypothetical protein WC329_04425 [Candidatus Omnitrophota bacterium]|jgi:hypothetical protein
MAIKGEKAISAGVEAVIDAMSAAIQEFEGWYPGSRSFRNNNPGNLRNVQGLAGQIGLDETGHIIFNSYASGLAALKRQLRLVFTGGSHIYSPADSLASFFSKYAEGNQAQYAAYVAGRLGVDVNTTFQQLSS